MSHRAKILGVKVSGAPFLGYRAPRDVSGDRLMGPAVPVWSSNPWEVMDWLAAGYRARFNQHRALRSKYTYEDDPDHPGRKRRMVDGPGDPVLATLGDDPEVLTDPEARRVFAHVAAVPQRILHMCAREENESWWAGIKRRKTRAAKGLHPGSMPGFMSRKHHDRRFTVLHHNGRGFTLTRTGRRTGVITITGQNPAEHRGVHPAKWKIRIRIRLSRPVENITSAKVNLDKTTVSLVYEPAAVTKRPTGSVVGIDRGVAHTAVTSDGQYLDAPDVSAEERKIVFHQRRMAKSRRINNPTGDKRWKPTQGYLRHQAAHAEAQRRKTAKITDFQQKATTELVRGHDVITIEDLRLSAMMRSAKGTAEAPGKNVAAKAGLNRSLSTAALGRFGQMIAYKTAALNRAGHGQILVMVPAYNTSRECNRCGYTAAENRESQAVFACKKCGHTAHADANAACNIEDRGMQARGWTWENSQPDPEGLVKVAPAGSKDKTDPTAVVPKPTAEGGACEEPRTNRARRKDALTGISGL